MKFTISAKSFIIDKDDRVLILKRSDYTKHKPLVWEIPGGRLRLGEDPIKALKRETKEETGLDIDIIQSLNIQHFTRDDGQIITMIIFLCKALNNNVELSEEHSDFDWIPLEQCKEKLSNLFHKEVDIFNKLELHKHL